MHPIANLPRQMMLKADISCKKIELFLFIIGSIAKILFYLHQLRLLINAINENILIIEYLFTLINLISFPGLAKAKYPHF